MASKVRKPIFSLCSWRVNRGFNQSIRIEPNRCKPGASHEIFASTKTSISILLRLQQSQSFKLSPRSIQQHSRKALFYFDERRCEVWITGIFVVVRYDNAHYKDNTQINGAIIRYLAVGRKVLYLVFIAMTSRYGSYSIKDEGFSFVLRCSVACTSFFKEF